MAKTPVSQKLGQLFAMNGRLSCIQSLAFGQALQIAKIFCIQTLPHPGHHRLEKVEKTAQSRSSNTSDARPLGHRLEVKTSYGLEKTYPVSINAKFFIWFVFRDNESRLRDRRA